MSPKTWAVGLLAGALAAGVWAYGRRAAPKPAAPRPAATRTVVRVEGVPPLPGRITGVIFRINLPEFSMYVSDTSDGPVAGPTVATLRLAADTRYAAGGKPAGRAAVIAVGNVVTAEGGEPPAIVTWDGRRSGVRNPPAQPSPLPGSRVTVLARLASVSADGGHVTYTPVGAARPEPFTVRVTAATKFFADRAPATFAEAVPAGRTALVEYLAGEENVATEIRNMTGDAGPRRPAAPGPP
jgi:hypothetical protein